MANCRTPEPRQIETIKRLIWDVRRSHEYTGHVPDEREDEGCAQQCSATANTAREKQQCISHWSLLCFSCPAFPLCFFPWFSAMRLLSRSSLHPLTSAVPFGNCIFGIREFLVYRDFEIDERIVMLHGIGIRERERERLMIMVLGFGK